VRQDGLCWGGQNQEYPAHSLGPSFAQKPAQCFYDLELGLDTEAVINKAVLTCNAVNNRHETQRLPVALPQELHNFLVPRRVGRKCGGASSGLALTPRPAVPIARIGLCNPHAPNYCTVFSACQRSYVADAKRRTDKFTRSGEGRHRPPVMSLLQQPARLEPAWAGRIGLD
jgi:hypothetical protein